jgi:SAM-dependent methyltransferase
MGVFNPASPAQIRRYFPDFRQPAFVHNLQGHIVSEPFWRLFADHTDRDSVIIDLGCGSGTTVLLATERVATAIGVDIADDAFRKNEGLTVVENGARELHLRRGGFLIKCDLTKTPLSNGVADLVTSRWVFEHLADPRAAVAEIHRLLKPGGVALVIAPNRRHPGIFLTSFVPPRAKQRLLGAFGGVDAGLVLPTFYRINTERSMDQHFVDGGFERLSVEYVRDPSYWMFSATLFRVAVNVGRATERLPLRRFQMHMIGLYRKQHEER